MPYMSLNLLALRAEFRLFAGLFYSPIYRETYMARFLKSASLIIIAASIWACRPPESAKSTSSEIASETVPSTVKDKMKRKNFRYDTDGKTDEDHLYLEEVLGDAALSEVKSWNARSLARLESDPRFEAMQAEALSILNSKDKIPYVSYQKGKVQNFWQDADHVRGIWRRASLESYLSGTQIGKRSLILTYYLRKKMPIGFIKAEAVCRLKIRAA